MDQVFEHMGNLFLLGALITVSYLQPFGCTSYVHVPLDLNQSKLNPRLVKTALLGYFGYDRYKLLDKSTSAVFKSRDVIFEEGITCYC